MHEITLSMSKGEAEHLNTLNHIEEAFLKISRLEVKKVTFTLQGKTIEAYDSGNDTIRIDIKYGV